MVNTNSENTNSENTNSENTNSENTSKFTKIKRFFFRKKQKKVFSVKVRQIIPGSTSGEYSLYVNNNRNPLLVKFNDIDKNKNIIMIDNETSNIFYVNRYVTESPYYYFMCFINSKTIEELIKDRKNKKVYDIVGLFVYNNELKNEIIHTIKLLSF
jgi:hypothetical protein